MKTHLMKQWRADMSEDVLGHRTFLVAADTPEDALQLLYAELGARVGVERIQLMPERIIVERRYDPTDRT